MWTKEVMAENIGKSLTNVQLQIEVNNDRTIRLRREEKALKWKLTSLSKTETILRAALIVLKDDGFPVEPEPESPIAFHIYNPHHAGESPGYSGDNGGHHNG